MASSDPPAATVADAPPETATWTQFLPEAFGIRENIQNNPFRWCVRESLMWGIATGSAMGLHRFRMQSHPFFAVNVAFATTFLVSAPSYYFCYRRREHKEYVIETMMKANDFAHEEEMPEPVPIEDHPFLEKREIGGKGGLGKEFEAHLEERKEWQKQLPMEDAKKVFKEVKKDR